ncbi:MAG: hypothetical protein KKB37_15175, partial [Alphaproteobacteria bacterium]|nr:hypothetical protein [Alphaproteobacteria bacterium]
ILLFMLFALAIGKVGAQSYIRQQSASETILNAYRGNALAACRQQTLGTEFAKKLADQLAVVSSKQPSANGAVSVELVIGKRDVNVRLWQTSHAEWSTRYSDPFIVVRASNQQGTTVCEYNINRGSAHAHVQGAAPSGNG